MSPISLFLASRKTHGVAITAPLETMERYAMASPSTHRKTLDVRQWHARIAADLGNIDPWALSTTLVITGCIIALNPVDPWHVAVLLACAPMAVAIAWLDLRTQRIPDVLLAPCYLIVGLGLVFNADVSTALRSLTVFLIATSVLAVGTLAGQVGFGDVKLGGFLALILAWDSYSTALNAALVAIIVAGLYAIWLLSFRRATQRFAFGPSLLLGGLVAIAFS